MASKMIFHFEARMSDTIASPAEIQRNGRHAGPDWSRISAQWQDRESGHIPGQAHNAMRHEVILHFAEHDEVYRSVRLAAEHYRQPRHRFSRSHGDIAWVLTENGMCWVEVKKLEATY